LGILAEVSQMALADRLGLAALILGLVAIAAPMLWPDKKWIGWVSLGFALLLAVIWASLELGSSVSRFGRSHVALSSIAVFVVSGVIGAALWLLIVLHNLDPASPTTSQMPGEAATRGRAELHWYRTNAIHSPDPLPVGKQIEFQVSFLNLGNDRAVKVFGYPYLAIAEGKDLNYQRFAAAMFEPAWQQSLAMQRITEPNGRPIEPVHGDVKDELGFTVHGPVLRRDIKRDIIAGKKFLFLVAAVRYQDSSGEHEFRVCRYLEPPFADMKTWSAGSIHEDTIDIPKASAAVERGSAPIVHGVQRDWLREWKEQSTEFEKLANWGVRAHWQRSRSSSQWMIQGGGGIANQRMETLCKLAGQMLVTSPKISLTLTREITGEPDPVDRWLSYLKSRKPTFWHEELPAYEVHDDGHKTPIYFGTLQDVVRVSADQCLECAAEEC
jgi:hypothetical protein